MRKFKTCPPRTLPFRSLLILAGAFLLLAAFAPSANAALIVYFNFEGSAESPFPVNLDSHMPAVDRAPGCAYDDHYQLPCDAYPDRRTTAEAGLPLNLLLATADQNLNCIGLHRAGITISAI